MDDLPTIRDWIEEQVSKYRLQLGLPIRPIILYGLEDKAPKSIRNDKLAKNYKQYCAVSFYDTDYKKQPYVILNLPHHQSIKELENTIVHEMIHIRFPKLECSDNTKVRDFYENIGMALMGKTWKKVGRKKKVNKK